MHLWFPQSGANGLIECLRNVFMRFGVPVELASNSGPEFVASKTKEFFNTWEIDHRLSSAYHPQSNGRAELAVKTAKCLLRNNTGPSGTLNTVRSKRPHRVSAQYLHAIWSAIRIG